MSATLDTTMDALAAKLVAAGVKNVQAQPQDGVKAPAVMIGYPTTIDFDMTFTRGADRMVFPVFAIAGGVMVKSTRGVLSAFIAGAASMKTALDGPLTVGAGTRTVRVTNARPETVMIGGVELVALVFDTEVFG